MTPNEIKKLIELRNKGETWNSISKKFKGHTPNALRKTYYRNIRKPNLKVLIIDIETAPLLAYVWGLWDNNVALNQIKSDWYILSYAAKWLHDPSNKVIYNDQRGKKNIEDDSSLLKEIWKLMDEADVLLTQNGKKFDVRKINARLIQHKLPPPSSFRQIDTMVIAKKVFGFTSNKLEYMTHKLNVQNKKLKHAQFGGFELWKECLAGNKAAWDEMKEYNIMDILSLEELYHTLKPWDKTINFNVFNDDEENLCSCGSNEFTKKGFVYTNSGKYHRYICDVCGAEQTDKENLLSKEKRKSLRK